jgi:hypothetical protein
MVIELRTIAIALLVLIVVFFAVSQIARGKRMYYTEAGAWFVCAVLSVLMVVVFYYAETESIINHVAPWIFFLLISLLNSRGAYKMGEARGG